MNNIHLYLAQYHRVHVKRYNALSDPHRAIADFALRRYIGACVKHAIRPEDCGIEQIINDASHGLNVIEDIEPGEREPETFSQSSLLARGKIAAYVRRIAY